MEVGIRKITPTKVALATLIVGIFFWYLDNQRKIDKSNAEAVQKLYTEDMVNKQSYLSELAKKVGEKENDIYSYYDNINRSIEADRTAYKTVKFYLIQLESIVIDRKDELCKIDDESDDWCGQFLRQGRPIYNSFHPFVCKKRQEFGSETWKKLEEYLLRGLGKDMKPASFKKRCDKYKMRELGNIGK